MTREVRHDTTGPTPRTAQPSSAPQSTDPHTGLDRALLVSGGTPHKRARIPQTQLDPSGIPCAELGLSTGTLHLLNGDVRVPTYDRQALEVGHVHFGPGRLFASLIAPLVCDHLEGQPAEWEKHGIATVSFRSRHPAADNQDCLFSLTERGPARDAIRVVGSVVESLYAPERPQDVLERLARSAVTLVTLSVKDGIPLRNGSLDLSAADIQHDLSAPRAPQSPIGYLVEALRQRREQGVSAFTVLSLDNRDGNGDLLRDAVLTFAGTVEPELRAWIAQNVPFPNVSADRITPCTGDPDLSAVAERLGVRDDAAIIAEPFRQLVVSQHGRGENGPIPAQLPAWFHGEHLGVVLTDAIDDHVRLKFRVVNTTHVVVAWLGTLAGANDVHEVLSNPAVAALVRHTMRHELAGALKLPDGISVDRYVNDVMTRFQNPNMADPLSRLNNRGWEKIPQRLLAALEDAFNADCPTQGLTLAVAAWILSWNKIAQSDAAPSTWPEDKTPLQMRYIQAARSANNDPNALVAEFLAIHEIFNARLRDLHSDLGQTFITNLANMVRLLQENSLEEVAQRIMAH